MKVVILAGGKGTRLSEYTETIPKPMISISGEPILIHIMKIYLKYKYNTFYVALGYKSEFIINYFEDRFKNDIISNNTINSSVKALKFKLDDNEINLNLVNTGINSMTGGRIKQLKYFFNDENFMLTYGDGVANINIDSLVKFHNNHGKLVTVSAVQPPSRFGSLELNDNKVVNFNEKSQLKNVWINGGFFVINSKFIDFIDNDKTYLEKEPLENAAKQDNLRAFRHYGFWQCMDTSRDKEYLENLCKDSNPPWIN